MEGCEKEFLIKDQSINTGDLQTLDESSQSSICNIIRKMKIYRRNKQKRKSFRGNPFDIGRCEFSKANKGNRRNNSRVPPPKSLVKSNSLKVQRNIDKEALEIVQMAEDMGLKLKKSRMEALKEIKEQMEKALI